LIINNCQLEIDQERGVIYVHSPKGHTALRICGCPTPIPNPSEYGAGLDITFKFQKFESFTFNWNGKTE